MVHLVSVGKSGRIVIEIEPVFKQQLYLALGEQGKSLKSWFLENAESFLKDQKYDTNVSESKSQKELGNV